MSEKIKRAEKSLERLLNWISAADSRVRLVLPLATAMLGALAVLAPAIDEWKVCAAIFASVSGILLFLSVIFTACASFPRASGPLGSTIYFGGIVTRELDQYKRKVHEQSDDEYLDDLLCQCHRNAQIAERKFNWIQKAMMALLVATLPWLLAIATIYAQG